MNPTRVILRVVLALACTFALPLSHGQSVEQQQPEPNAEQSSSGTVPPTELDEAGEVVVLAPFLVSGENRQRYLAADTLAGTRVRTNIDDLAASISIVTKEFLKDTGSNDSLDLLVYTTNTEVGGIGGNFGGHGNGSSLFERSKFVSPNTNTRVRGLAAADNTRNYFSSSVPWDSYNTAAITISRGANSILFGLGSPAGIINNSTNQAEFKDANRVEWTAGEYGSQRFVLDINKVILPDELAIRLEGLHDKEYYKQKPAYSEDQRFYAALRYDPKFLDRAGMHTTLSVTYEDGSVHSNNPRTLPPVDKITPWFSAMGKRTFSGLDPVPVPATEPWLAPEGIQGGPRIIFTDPTSQSANPAYAVELNPTVYNGLNTSGARDGSILGLTMPGRSYPSRMQRVGAYWNYSLRAGLPFSTTLNPYKDIYIQDPSIFDFYGLLMDGPNKAERRKFDVLTADLTQTFWRNRLGLQGVWSVENYEDGFYGILGWGGPGDTSISVDINQLMPDGTPNPNVGRPMIESHSGGGIVNSNERKNSRYTAFADLNSSDFMEESWLTKVLGRHKLTGAYTVDDFEQESVTFNRTGMDYSYLTITGGTAPVSNGLPMAGFIAYIGSDLRSASGTSGLALPNLQTEMSLSLDRTRFFDSRWAKPVNASDPGYVNPADPWTGFDGTASTQSENPANYIGWTTGATGVLVSDYDNYKETAIAATKNRLNVKSEVFVWQGFLLDGTIIPTWSVRKDTVRSYNKTAPRNANNVYDVDSPNFVLSDTPNTTVDSTIHSLSIVAHTPKFIRKHLPWNSNISLLYNDATNFQVQAGRVDLEGTPVPNPSGTTREYGVVITTLNDRLRFKIAKYETALENARLGGAYNEFVIGLSTIWLYANAKRLELGLSGDPAYSVANSGYGFNLAPFPGVSEAETRAKQQAMVNAVLAPGALPSDKFFQAWGINKNDSNIWLGGLSFAFAAPPGITATTKSESEGWEFELDFQPTKNWTVTANASHDTAKFNGVAENFLFIVDQLQTLMEGPAGEMGYAYDYTTPGVSWGRGAGTAQQTLWNQFFYSPWKLIQAQNNTNLPEIRPWRFNLITNYNFDEGRFKGFNIGGGYRWEDKVAIGYPVFHDTVTDSDTFDVANPYYGPKESHIDLWVGYERKLNRWLDWRIQLNVRNVAESPSLVPISSQPDGTASAVRISNGQSIRVTNTFSF
jgi:hypothetical protein